MIDHLQIKNKQSKSGDKWTWQMLNSWRTYWAEQDMAFEMKLNMDMVTLAIHAHCHKMAKAVILEKSW